MLTIGYRYSFTLAWGRSDSNSDLVTNQYHLTFNGTLIKPSWKSELTDIATGQHTNMSRFINGILPYDHIICMHIHNLVVPHNLWLRVKVMEQFCALWTLKNFQAYRCNNPPNIFDGSHSDEKMCTIVTGTTALNWRLNFCHISNKLWNRWRRKRVIGTSGNGEFVLTSSVSTCSNSFYAHWIVYAYI